MSENNSPDTSEEKGTHILDEKPGMHGRQAYIWFFALLIAALVLLFGIIIPLLNLILPGTGDSYRDFLLSGTLIADISLILTLWGLGWIAGTLFNIIRFNRKARSSEEL